MKSYYDFHENAYQQLISKGFVGWGQAKSLEDLGDKKTFAFLDEKLQKHFKNPAGKSALDLGCGTGTTAFIFAKHGLKTTGIDVSETAINKGRELAAHQNLNIQFVSGDVLNLQALQNKFDLIYDSHFLHCVVLNEDRLKVLSEVKKSLNSNGLFILDTMVLPEHCPDPGKLFGSLRLDEDGILWHKTTDTDFRGASEFNGEYWCPQRRIHTVNKVIEEVKSSSLEIVEMQIDDQEGNPSMLRMVLK